MLLFGLLLTECVLFYIAWNLFKHDLFSPSVFTLALFIIATSLNIWEINNWKIEFHYNTFFIISAGLLFAVLGELFAHSRGGKKLVLKENTQYIIFISLWHQLILSVVSVILTYLYFREMMQFIITQALDNIGDAKELMTEDDLNINPIIKQGYKVLIAEAYICGYVFFNNLVLSSKLFKRYCILLVPIICAILITVIGGNRIEVLKIVTACFFFYYIIKRKYSNWRVGPNRQIIKYSLPFVVVFLIAFSGLRVVTKSGVDVQENMGGVIDYTAYYGGSPIQVLNLKLEIGIENWKSDMFARQSLAGIYEFLKKNRLLEREKPPKLNSMVYVGGNSNASGNVFTIFGRPLIDFGVFGTFITIFFLYYFFSVYYYSNVVRIYNNRLREAKKTIYYVFFFTTVILFSFYDFTLYLLISQTGLLQMLVMYFLIVFHFSFFKYVRFKHNNTNI